MLVLPVLVLVGDVVGDGEVGAVVVDGTHLEGPAVGHGGVDTDGVVRSGELVPLRAYAEHVREADRPGYPLEDLDVLLHLELRILLGHVAGVRLEEVDLPDPDERTGLLGLVPEGVDDLVRLQRKVLVGPDP